MELIAMDNVVPPHKVNTSILELIKMGYKKSKAAEINTAKISYL
jgi:hypothetical protein